MKNIILSMILWSSALYADESKKTYELTWVLSHEPITLFEEAAKRFSHLAQEKSQGQIKVKVVSAKKLYGSKVLPRQVYQKLIDGEIQMSQGYTTALGQYSNPLWVLDLPFLFRDHNHASKVLDGKIGQDLLAGLEKSNIKGLAFTYSGGFRIIPSVTKEINRYEDIKGMKVSIAQTPVFVELYKKLGATPVAMSSLDIAREQLVSKTADASESTYPRFLPLEYDKVAGVVNETDHSLFLTSLIINKAYFDSLPKNIQRIISEAALEAGKLERNLAIKSRPLEREQCLKKGIKVVAMSEKEKDRFKDFTKNLYKSLNQYFPETLVTSIKNTK